MNVLGKKALIYSVPGTGTGFTRKLIEVCFNYAPVSLEKMLASPVDSRCYAAHHVDAERLRLVTQEHPDIKTVIPLRSPVAQYITRWQRMNGGRRNASRATAVSFWQTLKESLNRYNYVFLPIEEGFDRGIKIWRVAKHLETLPDALAYDQFCKEWPKVNSGFPQGTRPERAEYDANGKVTIDGHPMGFLDEAMDWYHEQIARYGEAA